MTIRRKGNLTLDPIKHEYKKDGIKFPSVTQILEIIDKNKKYYTEESASRGQQVHEITADFDKGKKVKVPIDYLGYLDAWKKFLFEYHLGKADIIEKFFYSDYGFFGTLDRAWKRQRTIVDIKTGAFAEKDMLQLEGYLQLLMEIEKYKSMNKHTFRLILVYLKPDGSYKPVEFCHDPKRFVDFQCIKRTFDIREGRK